MVEDARAGAAAGYDFRAGDDFVAVGVVEVGCRGLPAVFVEFDAYFLIDAGFGFQVGIAHKVAVRVAAQFHGAAVTARVQDEFGIALVQVGGFVGARDAAFDQQVCTNLLGEVERGTPVAAAFAVVVVAQGRYQFGGRGQRNIVFDIDCLVLLRCFAAAYGGNAREGRCLALVGKALAVG